MYVMKKLIATMESQLEPAPNDTEALMAEATEPHPLQEELSRYLDEFDDSEVCIEELHQASYSLEALAAMLESVAVDGVIPDSHLPMANLTSGLVARNVGMESIDISQQLKISMETIGEKLASIAKAVINFIARMINIARAYLSKWFGGYNRLKKGVAAVIAELKTLSSNHELSNKHVDVKFRQGSALQINGKVDEHTVTMGLHNTAAVANYLYVIYPRLVQGIFGLMDKMELGIHTGLGQFASNRKRWDSKDYEAMELLGGALGKLYDNAYEGAEQVNQVLPGGYRLIFEAQNQEPKKNEFKQFFSRLKMAFLAEAGTNARSKVDHVKATAFAFHPPVFKSVDKSHSDELVTLNDMNLGNVQIIAKALETLVGFIDQKKYVVDELIKEIDSFRSKFESNSRRYSFLSSKFGNTQYDLIFRAYSNAITSPYLRPILQFDSLIYRSMHASLSLCQTIIAALKTKKKETSHSETSNNPAHHQTPLLGYNPA